MAFQAVAQEEQTTPRAIKIDVINVHPYAPVLLQTDFVVSQSTEVTQNSQVLQPLFLCKHSDSTGYSKWKEC